MSSEQTDALMVNDSGHGPINSIYTTNNKENNHMNTSLNNHVNATFAAPTGERVDAADAGVPQLTVLTGGMRRKDIGKIDLPITDCHDALAYGGLDFEVEYRSLHDISGGTMDSPAAHRTGHIVRKDNNVPLGRSVTAAYSVQQTSVLGDIGNHVCRAFGGYPTNVIAKGDGEDVGLTIQLPTSTYIGVNRKLIDKLTLLKGHGGVRNIVAVAHGTDIFCTNQIVSMLRNGEQIASISHTASADLKLSQIHHQVLSVLKHQDEWNQALIELSEQKGYITPVLDRVFGMRPDTRACKTAQAERAAERRWADRRERVINEYDRDFNNGIWGTKLGVLWAFQGSEEHYDGRGNMRTDKSKVGRFINQTQPLAEKAYAILTA